MSLISLLISILILSNSTFASENYSSNLSDFFERQSKTILNIPYGFPKKRSNSDLNIPVVENLTKSIKKVKKDDNRVRFEKIYAKWGKRPSELNCAWAPRVKRDRRHDTTKLRIMSYNAEWLFLYGGSGSIQCPGSGCPWKNLGEAQYHIMQTVDLLVRIDPDIVHLNEVEDCRVLHVIMELLPKNHGYRAYLIRGTDNMTGQNVAMLTRVDPISDLQRTDDRKAYPVADTTCGTRPSQIFGSNKRKRSGTMGLSKHYLTSFKIGDLNILWAGAHFIAHPSNVNRCYRREAQAAVLSEFINAHLTESNTEVVITGDFNDHDEEILGANNVPPLSSVLRILKNGKTKLHSVASLVEDPLRRYTSWHDINGNCADDGPQEHSLIDHVLLTPGLKSRVSSVWMDHNKTISCRDRASDHWPIIIEFST